MKDAFKERERAMEEEFFHRVDQKLLASLKGHLHDDSARRELMAATGISDESLLQELVDIGVSKEAVAAVALIPLVLTAWADGKVDDKEKPAVMKAAAELGVAPQSPAEALLESWLQQKADAKLEAAWRDYVAALVQQLQPESVKTWRKEVMVRAEAIARASGGTLGFGSISPSEAKVLKRIEEVLSSVG